MNILNFLYHQTDTSLWLIFLAENLLVSVFSLMFGALILKLNKTPSVKPSSQEYRVFLITNLLNTVITYCGFKLCQHGFINFSFGISYIIIPHFVLLFLAMDLAMYVFHYAIHHSVVYNAIHKLHHQYHNPTPIDLYVLHPIETLGFGALWLIILSLYSFNFYAVIIYLAVNVLFGIIGHLGFEPLPAGFRNILPFKLLGTSTFHHNHHTDVQHNFGFYTIIWDKLFGTYKG